MSGYFIISVLLAAFVAISSRRVTATVFSGLFYLAQILFFVRQLLFYVDRTALGFFTFDRTGMLFFGLMAFISPLVWVYSAKYLKQESVQEYKLFHGLMILLCAAVTGVYFSNDLAVSWIFLEGTTLCTAGLVYHRRTERSLEATWKYVFVCSTGIAIAYLGILLMSTAAAGGALSYENLAASVDGANPLYIKLAFLFILAGYSCKMEVFPLYTIGVDANHAAPTPASALISTALVNAGFVSLLRVYKVVARSEIFAWASHVMILTGVLSILFGAFFLRRTNNYKRLLSYSTVENMGLVLIGLGLGGAALAASLLHVVAHTLVKSGLFLQLSRVGKVYGTYRINRIAGYMGRDGVGAPAMLVGSILLVAFPPSPLFVSELALLSEMIATGRWWLVAVVVLLLCVVIYSVLGHVVEMCSRPHKGAVRSVQGRDGMVWMVLLLLVMAMVLGLWRHPWIMDLFKQIVSLS